MISNVERFKKVSKEKGIMAAFLKIIPYVNFLLKKKSLEKKWNSISLKSGKLEIKGWNTGPKIYWDGRELTKNIGLNTSVFINGRWHDSSKADWELVEANPDSLKIRNQWRSLPLKEIWTIAALGDNRIACKIELENEKDIEFIEQKFAVMLDERFDRWFASGNKSGDFAKFKDWSNIKEVERDSVFIGARSNSEKDLPEIVVKRINTPQRNFYTQIQNSDYKTRARLLNIVASSRDSRLSYKKGISLFFNTEISIK